MTSDPAVNARQDKIPPLITLLDVPDLTVEAPDMSAHDAFDRNFDRRVYRDKSEDIAKTPKNFTPVTNPDDDNRLHRYFRIPDDVDPSVTHLYKTFYINYRNDLETQAIWFAPMSRNVTTNAWQMAGPTRFITLAEYMKYFHPSSKPQPFD